MSLSRMVAMFLYGFVGSAAVEVVMIYQHFQDDSAPMPERYKKPWFWFVRFLLALMGGGLALAYEIDKPLLAINIGAATPLLIKAFAEGFKPSQYQDGRPAGARVGPKLPKLKSPVKKVTEALVNGAVVATELPSAGD